MRIASPPVSLFVVRLIRRRRMGAEDGRVRLRVKSQWVIGAQEVSIVLKVKVYRPLDRTR